MEQKLGRRHTEDDSPVRRGSKGGYSLEQKFADFVKLSPDETAPESPDAKAYQRRATEGCDTKLVACPAESKGSIDDADDSADREFESMMRAPNEGSAAIAADPKARDIALGFGM